MSLNDPIGPEKYDAYQEPQFATPPEKKGPGCLFWGCLISGILFVVTIILVIALVFFVRGKIVDVMKEYTEPTPAELPEIQITDEERQEVIDRWEGFQKALDEGRDAELALDSTEFNIVAAQLVPESSEYVHFTVEGNQLKGQVSLPVGEFGQKLLRTDQLDGRYFNASGSFDVFLRNGLLVLQLQDAEVKGEPVPADAMQQIRTQNLAENLANDPEKRELFSKFERIEVKDGKILMTSKGSGAAPAEAEAEAEAGTTTEAEPVAGPDAADTPTVEPEAEAVEPEADPAPPAESEAEPDDPGDPAEVTPDSPEPATTR